MGKREEGIVEQNLGYYVVYKLIQYFVGKNYYVFYDNIFLIVKFVKDLLEDNIYFCVIVRENRKEFFKSFVVNIFYIKYLR